MNLRISGPVAFAMIVLLPFHFPVARFASGSLFQQPINPYKMVSRETYERVLKIVFPRDKANLDYDLVLSFEPSFAPESQIVVRSPTVVKGAAVKVEIVEYTSLSGNIYRKLNTVMAHGGKEDPVEMAKLVQVQRRVIEIPIAKVRKWRRGLADSIGASMKTLEQRAVETERGVGTVTLDGTFYDLWYEQVGGHISFSLLDQEVSNREVTGVLQLVRWMNNLRLDIGKSK